MYTLTQKDKFITNYLANFAIKNFEMHPYLSAFRSLDLTTGEYNMVYMNLRLSLQNFVTEVDGRDMVVFSCKCGPMPKILGGYIKYDKNNILPSNARFIKRDGVDDNDKDFILGFDPFTRDVYYEKNMDGRRYKLPNSIADRLDYLERASLTATISTFYFTMYQMQYSS